MHKQSIDFSIVIPCLNESESLPTSIPIALKALDLAAEKGLRGEILLADNGSDDDSREIALNMGIRVIEVHEKGYGSALIGGFKAAQGELLVMGDADASYDFTESIPMLKQLQEGFDICMGSRFSGEIKPGAMPWKNRYIGNPILTYILNLFFKTEVTDAHCGLRALTKKCLNDLKLTSSGMEFASEMIVKASLLDKKITEIPATLSPDVRSTPPHLKPWRDGWRHLIFLFLLSPSWIFLAPGILTAVMGIGILSMATLAIFFPENNQIYFFGNTWAILAGGLISLGQQGCIFSLAAHLYGERNGYRKKISSTLLNKLSLEKLIVSGAFLILAGIIILSSVFTYWGATDFEKISTVAPQVIGITILIIGVQNILGGLLLSIIGGNKSQFMKLK